MKIIPLSEGAYTVDRSKNFLPFNPATDNLTDRPHGSLLVEVQPFIVVTSSDVLLLDTGLGFTDNDDNMRIINLLSQHGLSPEDVSKVLISHLHKDHSGGILLPGKQIPTFPRATYYINRQEWNLAAKGSSSYKPDDFLNLETVEFIDGSGWITSSIEFLFTGGHSPFHQAFKIKEKDQTLFYGGDVASQYQQMKIRYKAKYDFDPGVAMDLRDQWGKEGKENGWTFLFYHDIKTPLSQL